MESPYFNMVGVKGVTHGADTLVTGGTPCD